MPESLPERPNLDQLKKQAKELQSSFNSGELSARERVKRTHPESAGDARAKLKLSEAQLVLAREYGFSSWPKLREHVEALRLAINPMEALIQSVSTNDTSRARSILHDHPELRPRLNDPISNFGFGATLLIEAVRRTNREMIDLLLQAGADINRRSDWWAGGFGVLDNDHGLASFLIERGARVDAHAAARLGMLDRLKELIRANPDVVHARGGDGQTPLHFASNVAIAEYLLEHGAQIDALDVDHESTPAQYMLGDRHEVARYLVTRGCRTDILMAAALGDLDLVRKHLQADPDCIRMSVSNEYFPKRNPHAGGTIYIWTLGQHKTPHQVARKFGHEDVFRLLMDQSPPELKLSQACELGEEEIFRQLLSSHPDLVKTLSARDHRKLAYAAQDNNVDAVRLMLTAGWPVGATGQHGATALHWAAFHGNLKMAKIILQHSPPLEQEDRDFHGKPIGWAIHGSEHGWECKTGDYAGTVKALLQAGATLPKELAGTEAVRAVLKEAGLK